LHVINYLGADTHGPGINASAATLGLAVGGYGATGVFGRARS